MRIVNSEAKEKWANKVVCCLYCKNRRLIRTHCRVSGKQEWDKQKCSSYDPIGTTENVLKEI